MVASRHGRKAERLAADAAARCADLATMPDDVHPLEDMAQLDAAPGHEFLAWWGFFSPFGPTESLLTLVPVEGAETRLLYFRRLHRFAQRAAVLGRIDAVTAHRSDALVSALLPLAGLEAAGLFTGPVTHVAHIDRSRIGTEGVRCFVLRGMTGIGAHEIEAARRLIRTYRLRPWDRVNHEMYLTLTGASRRLAAADGPVEPEGPAADTAALGRWWELVADPEHVASELLETGRAWEGAIEFQRSAARPLRSTVLRWAEAHRILERLAGRWEP